MSSSWMKQLPMELPVDVLRKALRLPRDGQLQSPGGISREAWRPGNRIKAAISWGPVKPCHPSRRTGRCKFCPSMSFPLFHEKGVVEDRCIAANAGHAE